jgi:thiamine-phosphate pyrophosphorylase
MKPRVDWSLYVVTGSRAAAGSALEVLDAAIRGGATAVQLREKSANIRRMLELGRALRELAGEARVPLIVNDRVDIALAIEADGVHVGQDDMPAELARRLLGPDRILGVSAGTVDEAVRAERDGADYLGVGDVFGTGSKRDAGGPIGLEGLARIARAVSIPVVAIGGITVDNAGDAIEAGAVGVASISAVFGSPEPEVAARRLRARIAQSLTGREGRA